MNTRCPSCSQEYGTGGQRSHNCPVSNFPRVPALDFQDNIATEKIRILLEAWDSLKNGGLSEIAFITVVGMIINPSKPLTQKQQEYARTITPSIRLEDKDK